MEGIGKKVGRKLGESDEKVWRKRRESGEEVGTKWGECGKEAGRKWRESGEKAEREWGECGEKVNGKMEERAGNPKILPKTAQMPSRSPQKIPKRGPETLKSLPKGIQNRPRDVTKAIQRPIRTPYPF